MADDYKRCEGEKLPGSINNKRDNLYLKQAFVFDKNPNGVTPKTAIFENYQNDTKNINRHQNDNKSEYNETNSKEEEKMLPKGLLDITCDKSDDWNESYFDYGLHSSPYTIPCFIAFLPQPNIDKCQPNFGHFNNFYLHPLPNVASYMRPQYIDSYTQYQRRQYETSLQAKSYPGMEYTWWNYMRSCHNPDSEWRSLNSPRSPNGYLSEKLLEPYYQSFGRYPFEFSQTDIDYNAHTTYSNQNNHGTFQDPLNRQSHKNFKHSKDSMADSNKLLIKDNFEDTETSNSTNFTLNTDDFENEEVDEQVNFRRLKIFEDIRDQESFYTTVLDACLQLEELFRCGKISCDDDIREGCKKIKNQLSNSKNHETISFVKAMMHGFFNICNSWIFFSSLKYSKKDHAKEGFKFESFIDSFEHWEDKSKILLENLIQAIQSTSSGLDVTIKENPFQNDEQSTFKENDNCESEKQEQKKTVKDQSDVEVQNSIRKKLDENKNHEMDYSGHFASKTSGHDGLCCGTDFIYDNLIKDLKNNREKKNIRRTDNIKLWNHQHKAKNNLSPRERNSLSMGNCKRETTFKREQLDDLFLNFKVPQLPLSNSTETSQIKEDVQIYNKIPCKMRSSEDNKKFSQKSEKTSLENDGYSNEHMNPSFLPKQNAFVNFSDFKELFDEKKSENEFSFSTNDARNAKRYSTRQKKKHKMFSKRYGKKCENDINENRQCMFVHNKLKLYDLLVGIQNLDLRKFLNEKITEMDMSKIKQSFIYPVVDIAHLLMRNYYKSINEVVDDLFALFYRAKCDNKGNIIVLIVANRLELKLINAIYEEIGTY